MAARSFTRRSRVESIAGVEIRITEPLPGDNLGSTRGAELGWSCARFDGILEPPVKGDAVETVASVETMRWP